MNLFLLLIFWSLWFVNFSSRTILSPLLPVIEDDLMISHALAGSIFSFMSAGYTISLLISGFLSPRIGYKRSIISGLVVLMVSVFIWQYATTYISIITASLMIGLGAGIYLPSAIPLITSTFRHHNWGKAIAFHETAASFSIFSIPILTTLGLRLFYWKTLFLILSTVILLAAIPFSIFSPDPRPHKGAKVSLSQVLSRKDFWVIAVLWIFAASNGLGLYNIIPLFLVKENGMQLEIANSVFGISRIGGFFVAIISGFLVDRFGVKKILLIILLTTALSTIGLSLAPSIPILVAMLFIQATVSTGFFPITLVAISKITTINERSIFTGMTIAIGVIFGLGLCPFILGTVADLWNFQIGIFVLGVLTSLSCLLIRKI